MCSYIVEMADDMDINSPEFEKIYYENLNKFYERIIKLIGGAYGQRNNPNRFI